MKIAIYEPEPRICGPVIWADHLKVGFQTLGHECDLITFTKSGKPRKHWGNDLSEKPLGIGWSRTIPDRCGKWDEAHTILDEYDLVILTEPKNTAYDKPAVFKGRYDRPAHIEFLSKTKTPWTTALHGPQYQEERVPFMTETFVGNWIGRGLTHGLTWDFDDTDPTGTLQQFEWEPAYLPYSPDLNLTTERSGRPVVGMTGRVTLNKGQHLVALLPMVETRDYDVDIWGAASKGLGPNFTYALWEFLGENGYRQAWRDGPRDENGDYVLEEDGTPKHTPLNPFPWRAFHGDQKIEYRGNYDDPVGVNGQLTVHVNLTSPKFSGGLTEFATLEAVNAGCRLVVNQNVAVTPFNQVVVDPTIAAKGPQKSRDDVARLLPLVDEALAMPDEATHANWRTLLDVHNPAVVAQQFLDLL